jgi:4-amino-4-deoxy-L-arabinose transferase-like glycosyltransferase
VTADPAAAVPAWARPHAVLTLILLYLLVHAGVRLALGPTLGIDDAEQALFAQQWQWSYRFRAPPLFTWLLLPLQGLFGPGIVALTVLRYLLLGVLFACTWLTARRLLADPRHAALATFSFATVYVFGYYSHHDLTHTTMMATLLAVSWWLFVHLCAAPSARGYPLLGLAFGVQ